MNPTIAALIIDFQKGIDASRAGDRADAEYYADKLLDHLHELQIEIADAAPLLPTRSQLVDLEIAEMRAEGWS